MQNLDKKIKMIEKYLGDIKVTNCDIDLEHSVTTQNNGKVYRVESNLFVPGEILRVEKTEKTINKAIDKVKDHLVLMIKKYKEKKIRSYEDECSYLRRWCHGAIN